jgi:hypothetical protein
MPGGPMDGPHALALNERLLELLADAGLNSTDAARAFLPADRLCIRIHGPRRGLADLGQAVRCRRSHNERLSGSAPSGGGLC